MLAYPNLSYALADAVEARRIFGAEETRLQALLVVIVVIVLIFGWIIALVVVTLHIVGGGFLAGNGRLGM